MEKSKKSIEKELKIKTLYDPEKPLEHSSLDRGDTKAEITNQIE